MTNNKCRLLTAAPSVGEVIWDNTSPRPKTDPSYSVWSVVQRRGGWLVDISRWRVTDLTNDVPLRRRRVDGQRYGLAAAPVTVCLPSVRVSWQRLIGVLLLKSLSLWLRWRGRYVPAAICLLWC